MLATAETESASTGGNTSSPSTPGSFPGFPGQANLLIDQLSILMALVVTGVSMLIHIYSAGYMKVSSTITATTG
jgi:NADH:ubiquinone oxidoreductase subunit 5 (subunit L)/multisubunit Na+/H+ antiporter MnhA subunit